MVYRAYLEHVGDEKLYVVVSNNKRNKALDDALAARITTSPKPNIDSIVVIGEGEPVYGRVLCDDIEYLYPDQVRGTAGAFSRQMMRRIDDGLRAAFDI